MSVRIPIVLVTLVDEIVDQLGYASRSSFVRNAIVNALRHYWRVVVWSRRRSEDEKS